MTTTQTINNYFNGYTLKMPTYVELSITSTGSVGGPGVLLEDGGGEVVNSGLIKGALVAGEEGVDFADGGTLVNGSATTPSTTIEGYTGVQVSGAAGLITNFGQIEALGSSGQAGIALAVGGTISNGATNAQKALISGQYGVVFGAAGALTNFGAVEGTAADGAQFTQGGNVANGAATDTTALIEGATAGINFLAKAGTVTNFGTVVTSSTAGAAVTAEDGGTVTNGSGSDTTALLVGGMGVELAGAPGTVNNLGVISGLYGAGVQADGGVVNNHLSIRGIGGITESGAATVNNFSLIEGLTGEGVLLQAGGNVYNLGLGGLGGAASIGGVNGVDLAMAGSVVNRGVISGYSEGYPNAGYGVLLRAGGTLVNGGGTANDARIEGQHPVEVKGGAGTVKNFGTILSGGAGDAYAVALTDGGSLTNGSLNNPSALIEGYGGVSLDGVGTNFGSIVAQGDTGGAGVLMTAGTMTNETTPAFTRGQIDGYTGVILSGSSELVNFGVIHGYGGTAVQLLSSAATIVDEPKSAFYGAVLGDGGTLDLSGNGSVELLFGGGDNVVASNGIQTTFTNFGTVEIGAGASFADDGSPLAAGQSLIVDGTFSEAGTLFVSGTVTSAGTIAFGNGEGSSGTLDLLSGASATFDAGSALSVANVTLAAGSTVTVNTNLTYASFGHWTQAGGTLSVAGGATMTFEDTSNSFSGTVSGAGTVILDTGSISGATLSVAHLVAQNAVTLSGTIAIPSVTTFSGELEVAAAGATLSGPGALVFNGAAVRIQGVTGSSTLTNQTRLVGEGLLGANFMQLVNGASGQIYSEGAAGLVIGTEGTITNAGLIVSNGGPLTVQGVSLDNTGELYALSGPLTVDFAVTGSGKAQIGKAGTLIFDAAFNQNVTFLSSAGGTLELADPLADTTGVITGLASTAENAIVLTNVTYASATTTYVYAGGATAGVLTIQQSGATVATLNLAGGTNYSTTSFTLEAGPGGVGTEIIDPIRRPATHAGPLPPTHAGPLPPTHAFIAAMAGFGPRLAAGPIATTGDVWRPPPMLASPVATHAA